MDSSKITSLGNKKLPFLYETSVSGNRLVTYAKYNGEAIGHCSISANSNKDWMISEWFVDDNFQKQGIGRELFKRSCECLVENFGYPDKIEYIWNGTNQYVFDWLQKNFAPVSMCPISVQKYSSDDDWLSHVYALDKDTFLEYFGISEKEQDGLEI